MEVSVNEKVVVMPKLTKPGSMTPKALLGKASIQQTLPPPMKKTGIDLSGVKPQLLTAELASEANLLITMGCGEACPYVPGLKREDWSLTDPKGKADDEVCAIRDEIKARVFRLLNDLNVLECCDLETACGTHKNG